MPIKDLDKLLEQMCPEIVGDDFVFCTVNKTIDMKIVPKMIFREKEGATLILRKSQAEEYNLDFEGLWTMIVLNVNSDL